MSSIKAQGCCLTRVRAGLPAKAGGFLSISKFVLENPSQTRNMGINELAAVADTSVSTVSRYCRKLGYTGYKEFQLDLAASIARTKKTKLDEFILAGSSEKVVEQVFEVNRQTLTDTEKILDMETLDRVVGAIKKAKNTYFFGAGGSSLMARYGAQRLLTIGLVVKAVEDPYEQLFVASSVKRGDVAVGLSHSGGTTVIVRAMRRARRNGARTVALTNYPDSPLAKICDMSLFTAFRENNINAAFSSSHAAQMSVLDSLYFILAGKQIKRAKKISEEINRCVKELLRS